MTPLLHPELVNGRFGDPALYVDCMFARRALLFDIGDLHALGPRKMLRISDVFVSHMHIDHFVGFDQLLRTLVGRERRVPVFGPAGSIERVGHKLAGYAWNLVERYPTDLVFAVTEVLAEDQACSATFRFRNRFQREDHGSHTLVGGLLCDDGGFRVRCAVLDHRIPCLGFAVEEPRHVNVWKDRLDRLGLPTGPWLRAAKQAILADQPDDTLVHVDGRALPLGMLKGDALRVVAGQKIGYIVDVAYTAENARRIAGLVADADILFIEAVFPEAEAARAADRAHLTTTQAGEIARLARAKRIAPFHFSPRHTGEGDRLLGEVEAAFGGAAICRVA